MKKKPTRHVTIDQFFKKNHGFIPYSKLAPFLYCSQQENIDVSKRNKLLIKEKAFLKWQQENKKTKNGEAWKKSLNFLEK